MDDPQAAQRWILDDSNLLEDTALSVREVDPAVGKVGNDGPQLLEPPQRLLRSEERRVGKEWRSRWSRWRGKEERRNNAGSAAEPKVKSDRRKGTATERACTR